VRTTAPTGRTTGCAPAHGRCKWEPKRACSAVGDAAGVFRRTRLNPPDSDRSERGVGCSREQTESVRRGVCGVVCAAWCVRRGVCGVVCAAWCVGSRLQLAGCAGASYPVGGCVPPLSPSPVPAWRPRVATSWSARFLADQDVAEFFFWPAYLRARKSSFCSLARPCRWGGGVCAVSPSLAAAGLPTLCAPLGGAVSPLSQRRGLPTGTADCGVRAEQQRRVPRRQRTTAGSTATRRTRPVPLRRGLPTGTAGHALRRLRSPDRPANDYDCGNDYSASAWRGTAPSTDAAGRPTAGLVKILT
jgi:hypothetical protein